MKIPQHTLIHYVRDNKGIPRGVMVAVKHEDGVCIGWSYCRKTDRFTKDMGLQIAIGRASLGLSGGSAAVPHKIAKQLDKFLSRANKYYKQYQWKLCDKS